MKVLFLLIVLIGLFACEQDENTDQNIIELPKGFPSIKFPDDNQFTEARWTLGKKLFYDTALSRDSSISCASCHKPVLAFSDDKAFSLGVGQAIGTRNAPSLTNVAYHPYFTREGGVPTLEQHILVPIQEHDEFGFNIVLIGERLRKNALYVKMAQEAYDQDPNPFVITRALATFERSLISGNSAFDQFTQSDLTALNNEEKNGMSLFFSDRTNCFSCHSGFNFTDYTFENNGLYEQYIDIGRMRLTSNEEDLALFKVPSLRNVGVTAPYMHDGSLATLEEVIQHYNSGGKDHVHKSPLIKPLNLSKTEEKELVAFLETLTDHHFLNNLKFR